MARDIRDGKGGQSGRPLDVKGAVVSRTGAEREAMEVGVSGGNVESRLKVGWRAGHRWSVVEERVGTGGDGGKGKWCKRGVEGWIRR